MTIYVNLPYKIQVFMLEIKSTYWTSNNVNMLLFDKYSTVTSLVML